MRQRLCVPWVVAVVAVGVFFATRPLIAGDSCRDFAYGNAGFGAGYSMAFARGYVGGGGWGASGGCPPRWTCRPRFCEPCVLWPTPCSMPCYVPVPYTVPVAYYVPYAVPIPYSFPTPWLGVNGAGRVNRGATALSRGSLPSRSSLRLATPPSARTRAARLVAEGDRQLLESRGNRQAIAAAAATYGRAAATSKDDPEIHLRHAIALAVGERRREADDAIGRAVALDGRLDLRNRDGAADPSAPSPLVARGLAILREIAADVPVENTAAAETIAVLSDRWAGRPSGPLAAIAEGRAGTR